MIKQIILSLAVALTLNSPVKAFPKTPIMWETDTVETVSKAWKLNNPTISTEGNLTRIKGNFLVNNRYWTVSIFFKNGKIYTVHLLNDITDLYGVDKITIESELRNIFSYFVINLGFNIATKDLPNYFIFFWAKDTIAEGYITVDIEKAIVEGLIQKKD